MQDKIDKLIPPPELLSYEASTAETFHELGLGFVCNLLIARGRLKPDERVLDLGSGCGQKARILTGYLSTSGSYEGLDILKNSIAWCRQAYADHPNFRFACADDLYSSHYNLNGRMKATEYEFPYSDAAFDMVFCASLFTHLLPDETANYFRQIARVLKPQGRVVFTAFLLNDEFDARGARVFEHRVGSYRLANIENPSQAVAVSENVIRAALTSAGLRLCEIAYGTWSGQPDLIGAFQDCLIAVRR